MSESIYSGGLRRSNASLRHTGPYTDDDGRQPGMRQTLLAASLHQHARHTKKLPTKPLVGGYHLNPSLRTSLNNLSALDFGALTMPRAPALHKKRSSKGLPPHPQHPHHPHHPQHPQHPQHHHQLPSAPQPQPRRLRVPLRDAMTLSLLRLLLLLPSIAEQQLTDRVQELEQLLAAAELRSSDRLLQDPESLARMNENVLSENAVLIRERQRYQQQMASMDDELVLAQQQIDELQHQLQLLLLLPGRSESHTLIDTEGEPMPLQDSTPGTSPNLSLLVLQELVVLDAEWMLQPCSAVGELPRELDILSLSSRALQVHIKPFVVEGGEKITTWVDFVRHHKRVVALAAAKEHELQETISRLEQELSEQAETVAAVQQEYADERATQEEQHQLELVQVQQTMKQGHTKELQAARNLALMAADRAAQQLWVAEVHRLHLVALVGAVVDRDVDTVARQLASEYMEFEGGDHLVLDAYQELAELPEAASAVPLSPKAEGALESSPEAAFRLLFLLLLLAASASDKDRHIATLARLLKRERLAVTKLSVQRGGVEEEEDDVDEALSVSSPTTMRPVQGMLTPASLMLDINPKQRGVRRGLRLDVVDTGLA